jgi:hypothetical protein
MNDEIKSNNQEGSSAKILVGKNGKFWSADPEKKKRVPRRRTFKVRYGNKPPIRRWSNKSSIQGAVRRAVSRIFRRKNNKRVSKRNYTPTNPSERKGRRGSNFDILSAGGIIAIFSILLTVGLGVVLGLILIGNVGTVKSVPISISKITNLAAGSSSVDYLMTNVEHLALGASYTYEFMAENGSLSDGFRIFISDAYYVLEEAPLAVCGDPVFTLETKCSCAKPALVGVQYDEISLEKSCVNYFEVEGFSRNGLCLLDLLPAYPTKYLVRACAHNNPLYEVSSVTGFKKFVNIIIFDLNSNSTVLGYEYWDMTSTISFKIKGFLLTMVESTGVKSYEYLIGYTLARNQTHTKMSRNKVYLGEIGLCQSATAYPEEDGKISDSIIKLDIFENATNAGLYSKECTSFLRYSLPSVSRYFDVMDDVKYVLGSSVQIVNFMNGQPEAYVSPWKSKFCLRIPPTTGIDYAFFSKEGDYMFYNEGLYDITKHPSGLRLDFITKTSSLIYWFPDHVIIDGVELTKFIAYDCQNRTVLVHVTRDTVLITPLEIDNYIRIPVGATEKFTISMKGTKLLKDAGSSCVIEDVIIKDFYDYYTVRPVGDCAQYYLTTDTASFPGGILYPYDNKFNHVNNVGNVNVTFTMCSNYQCIHKSFLFVTGGLDLNRFVFKTILNTMTFIGIKNKVVTSDLSMWQTWANYLNNYLVLLLNRLAAFVALYFTAACVIYLVAMVFYWLVHRLIIDRYAPRDIWSFFIFGFLDLILLYPLVRVFFDFVTGCCYTKKKIKKR